MKVALAPARPWDARPLARILGAWSRETPWMPEPFGTIEDRAALARLIREKGVITLRGRRGPVAFLARRDAEIHALYVAPAARGQGLGKRLLDEAKARSDRLTLWTAQANDGARRFYAREGFHAVRLGRGEGNDAELPDMRLAWQREEAG